MRSVRYRHSRRMAGCGRSGWFRPALSPSICLDAAFSAFTRVNGDLARLHLLRDFLFEVDDKQTVLQFVPTTLT